ncbi:conserved hypothetical protein [Ancylobacter novellus DSM 506]|uniref:Uncharacterized protein n=1 Tax=Ancylobacter novellus (strain ATCC 8093 / DSM 506 / JCM 20403 / CCM 1077 / IAM 12100 / NBRC 12443 / NCIMB 10456) TaxID=639283 RepID=D7A0Z6_ANCN5|nr:hypothetical protein [Ancylobacter novellus]ADH87506.1 conserved hypothetical protein [Ancylobacter novellus DSM 506]
MSTTSSDTAAARTRAFSRVIGPWLVIIPGLVMLREPEMGTIAAAFFANPALVWLAGGLMLFGGLLIIAFHPYWSGLAAVIISALGWLLVLRAVAVLAAPTLFEQAAMASAGAAMTVRLIFGLLVVAGLYLTYVGWLARPVTD